MKINMVRTGFVPVFLTHFYPNKEKSAQIQYHSFQKASYSRIAYISLVP
jgi:hypothetical protein